AFPVEEGLRVLHVIRLTRVDDALEGAVSQRVVRPHQEVLEHQPGWLGAVTRGAERCAVHAYPGPALVAGNDLGHRPEGRGEDELVEVEEGDPPRVFAMTLEAVPVRLELCREHR